MVSWTKAQIVQWSKVSPRHHDNSEQISSVAKIFVATTGLKGIMLASFALTKRLERAGHDVVCGSPIDNSQWADANQINFLQLPDIFAEQTTTNGSRSSNKQSGNWLVKLAKFVGRFLAYPVRMRRRIAQLRLDDCRQQLTLGKFDLLLCDVELHELILAAHSIGLPTLLLSPWLTLHPSDTCPPLNSLSSEIGDSDFSKDWQSLRNKNKAAETRQNFRRGFVSRKAALKRVAKRTGYPTENWLEYIWPQPFVCQNTSIISMVLEQLEFPTAPKTQMVYVGPMVDENRTAPQQSMPNFDIEFFESQKAAGKKIVLVTATTMSSEPTGLIEKLNAAALEHPNWLLILAPSAANTIPKGKAANLFLFDWIPQLELLRIADLSVNHGGINTINECIYFGVPMLIYPGGQHDQNGCTARARYHRIAKHGTNPQSIAIEIQAALVDQELKQRILTFKAYAHQYFQAKTLESYVEQSLNVN